MVMLQYGACRYAPKISSYRLGYRKYHDLISPSSLMREVLSRHLLYVR